MVPPDTTRRLQPRSMSGRVLIGTGALTAPIHRHRDQRDQGLEGTLSPVMPASPAGLHGWMAKHTPGTRPGAWADYGPVPVVSHTSRTAV